MFVKNQTSQIADMEKQNADSHEIKQKVEELAKVRASFRAEMDNFKQQR